MRILSTTFKKKWGFKKLLRMSCSISQSAFKEGSAEIVIPEGIKVFYNPVQEFNRDLSIAVLRVYNSYLRPKNTENFDILEALSATGLRSIRYAKEIPQVTHIVANDISQKAAEIIENNIQHNRVSDLVQSNCDDAISVMFNHRNKRFTAVDLDPYGSPSTFLDTAVQCVEDEGLLLVTATDTAVLCGNTPNTCYAKYGAVSLRNKACHEMAIRILLQCIESHANRYKRYIKPLLSISVDFYIRVFVQVFTSSEMCKHSTSKLSMVYQCCGCESLTLQPLGVVSKSEKGNTRFSIPTGPPIKNSCEHCDSPHKLGGPIWSAPIHDEVFVDALLIHTEQDCEYLNTQKRLNGIISMVKEELFDVPLYYTVDKLCNTVHSTSISMTTFRSAILNGSYNVSLSHACKTSVKTDAPMNFLWDIIRAWVKEHPLSAKQLQKDYPGRRILNKPMTYTIDFNLRRDANPASRELKLKRFQMNPTAFWGPGCRSTVNVDKPSKKERKQNKRKRTESPNGDVNVVKNLKEDKEDLEIIK